MKQRVAVLGAGSWGSALSLLLASNGCEVSLWVRSEKQRLEIEKTRENSAYLPGFYFPKNITFTSSLSEVIKNTNIVLCVLPSHAMRCVLSQLKAENTDCKIGNKILWISAAKGIEENTHLTMSQVIQEIFGWESCSEQSAKAPVKTSCNNLRIATLSGPSFAKEVAEKKPTALVAASSNADVSQNVQRIFSSQYFRVYTHSDIIGVEVGGTVKNVMAIAAGICDGLDLGMNARSALITRGLHEIIRLGTAMGGDPATFSGLSGIGDLVLTCTGALSRNRQVGLRIGRGESLEDIMDSMNMVAEGIKNTRSIMALGSARNIDLPITRSVYEILFCKKAPVEAVDELMNRILKEEIS